MLPAVKLHSGYLLKNFHRMPRPRGLTIPVPRPLIVSEPPRPPARPRVVPPRVEGAGTREPLVAVLEVLYFGVGLEEAGGFSTNETSVVL